MLSFYLVAAGLILNAVVQTYNPEYSIPMAAQSGMAALGFVLSIVFLLIHMRSTQLLHALEATMRAVEIELFPQGGFLTTQPPAEPLMRMRHLFPATYSLFALTFVILAVLPAAVAS